MTLKSYSKDDLKRLMQEKKNEKFSNKKIKSPLAGYDEDDNLFCKICLSKIENANLWTNHLASKEHKLNLTKIKKGKICEETNEVKKRKSDANITETKKQKIDLIKNNEEVKTVNQIETKKFNESECHSKTNLQTYCSNELPKGFFDNPEEDAKARDEIYKDPLDQEYSKFQRIIYEEDKVVDGLNEIEMLEAQNYRELTEVDEQIEHWNRINQLEIKRDEKKSIRKIENSKQEQSDQSDDELDLDEYNILSNWRR